MYLGLGRVVKCKFQKIFNSFTILFFLQLIKRDWLIIIILLLVNYHTFSKCILYGLVGWLVFVHCKDAILLMASHWSLINGKSQWFFKFNIPNPRTKLTKANIDTQSYHHQCETVLFSQVIVINHYSLHPYFKTPIITHKNSNNKS